MFDLMQEMSEALLAIDDFNVITVDWGDGSASLYSQSAANTRLVGLEVAYLINYLKVGHFRFSSQL
jgi:pancreatic triacylglycerol lipase